LMKFLKSKGLRKGIVII